ncbi:hypothetical protein ACFWGI_26950 [Streptomyces niveus]|uniref:hypothetical protein n=1 Tax=Streptomyces niveus TaxID=193462 RepID=UPI0036569071
MSDSIAAGTQETDSRRLMDTVATVPVLSTVGDEHGQRHRIPVCALNTYALDQWFWVRDGEPTP